MIKMKELLNEEAPGFKNRKFGDPLPTLKGMIEKHQKKEKQPLLEGRRQELNIPGDVSDYNRDWSETIKSWVGTYNWDVGPRESDMYDWIDRRHYDQLVLVPFKQHMAKVAAKLNTAAKELDGTYKMWNKLLDKARKKDDKYAAKLGKK